MIEFVHAEVPAMLGLARWGTAIFALLTLSFGIASSGVRAQGEPALLERKDVRIEDVRIHSLSPDGARIAGVSRNFERLCVYDVATLGELACADLSPVTARIMLEDLVWSPDGAYLAFGEQGLRLLRDGDLWLMDTATGALTNLTDDGFEGGIPLGDDDAAGLTVHLDGSPAWRPDGSAIDFARSTYSEGEWLGTTIETITVDGGEPQRLHTISPEVPGVAYLGMLWAPDGSGLYYSAFYPDRDDAGNGLWRIEADGTGAYRVLPGLDEAGPPAVNQISADGKRLLIVYPLLAARFASPDIAVYAVVDLETGIITPIGGEDAAEGQTGLIFPAGLSPDGTIVVGVSRLGDPENLVVAWPLDGGEPVVLIPEGLGSSAPVTTDGAVSWSGNGTILLNTELDEAVILTISGGTGAGDTGSDSASSAGDEASVVTLRVNDNDVPLRSQPGTEGQTVATLDRGTDLVAVGEPVEADGLTWLPVLNPATNTLGWVRVEFIDAVD